MNTTHGIEKLKESSTNDILCVGGTDLGGDALALDGFDGGDDSGCSTCSDLSESVVGNVGEGHDVSVDRPSKGLCQLDERLFGDGIEDGRTVRCAEDGVVVIFRGGIGQGDKVGCTELVNVGVGLGVEMEGDSESLFLGRAAVLQNGGVIAAEFSCTCTQGGRYFNCGMCASREEASFISMAMHMTTMIQRKEKNVPPLSFLTPHLSHNFV